MRCQSPSLPWGPEVGWEGNRGGCFCWRKFVSIPRYPIFKRSKKLPSRELTYPTYGEEKSSSQLPLNGICDRSLEGILSTKSQVSKTAQDLNLNRISTCEGEASIENKDFLQPQEHDQLSHPKTWKLIVFQSWLPSNLHRLGPPLRQVGTKFG